MNNLVLTDELNRLKIDQYQDEQITFYQGRIQDYQIQSKYIPYQEIVVTLKFVNVFVFRVY